ncbi:MAG TPA: LodA/GoxA family CTQ-dependent oxidase [Blastocatellia bacterium]|nr:LodA/GoxA family CTQ-dependent oxidase [Blastocatellia bacterium]
MAITSVRIHPAIGVARLGNSPEFFFGPEEPGVWTPPPGGTYKDASCRVKKQAARFRLFAFDGTTFVKELKAGDPDVAKIEWTVHLVNRKAASRRFETFGAPTQSDPADVYPAPAASGWRNSSVAARNQLVNDPGSKTLNGPNQAAGFNTGMVMGVTVPLGEMRTQADGALIVLGGSGNSGSFSNVPLQTFADNDGWYDDVSDGPVTAVVTLTGGATPPVEPSWVIVGPPKFAPAIQPIITMYDTLLQAWRNAHPAFDPGYSIDADVQPFYERLTRHTFVNQSIKTHSFNPTPFPAAGSALAQKLFNFLNNPAAPSNDLGKMPKMWSSTNEKNTAVHPIQHEMIKRWAGLASPALPQSSPPLAVYDKLDRAALEVCIGGNLYPGIEASWWMLQKFTYTAPLRLNHVSLKPGDITSQMAVPWQSDFSACFFYSDYAWWPAQRPDQVTRGGADNQDWALDFGDSGDRMVATWNHLGFVVPDGSVQIEKERYAVCKDTFIITDRNEFSMDEVDAVLSGGSPAQFSPAFYVVVEGFTPQELGFTSANPANLAAIAPQVTFLMPNAAVAGHMVGVVEAPPLLQSPTLTLRQRITFQYRVEFDGLQDFLDGVGNPIELQELTLKAVISGLTATAPVRLINKPNPYMIDGQTTWLSDDLRVFQVEENTTPFPGLTLAGNDAAAARTFIGNVIDGFNNPPAGPHPFDGISTNQATSKLELSKSVGGKRIFNFAVARVRYKAKAVDAKDVRVFFRMFTVAATGLEYRPNETYRTFTSGSGSIPLLGLQAGDIVTLPFFAKQREADMTAQTDPKNVMDLKASGATEFHGYFGCWLDFNQDEPLYPFHPSPPNGPFGAGKLSIQQLIKGKHQCLVAEAYYPPDAIPDQATPGSSDQLAQRNLLIVESDNPGDVDSHTVAHPFLIGARRRPRQIPAGLNEGVNARAVALPMSDGVDELMIRWGNLPRTSDMQIYLPGIAADDVLHQAALLIDDPRLERVDDNTVRLLPADVSFLPIPPEWQGRPVPGLLKIITPDTVRVQQQFRVVLHHISRAERRVVGTFQLTIPVDAGPRLLRDETRLYAVMQHIFDAVPRETPWYPILSRYLDYLAMRVRAFGGDPDLVDPSPDGGESPAEWKWTHSWHGRLCTRLRRIARDLCLRCKRCWAKYCGPRRP